MAANIVLNFITRGDPAAPFQKGAQAASHFSGVVQSSAGSARQLQAALDANAREATRFANAMGKVREGASSAWSPQISNAHKAAAELRATANAAKQAVQQMDNAGRQGAAGLDRAAVSAEKLDRRLDMIGKVAGGALALGGVNMFTSGIIKAGQEAAASQKKLHAMLAVRGESEGFKELNDSINQLSKQTGFDDDVFADASAHLLSFGLTAKQVKEILPGALAQSITMGQDLIGVVDSIGRGMASLNAGALRRTGVVISQEDIDRIKQLKEAGDIAGAQAALFDALQKSFKNYAVSVEDGLDKNAVKMGYFNKTLGDTQEIIGDGATNARAAWQSALTPMLESINENNEGLLHTIGFLTEIGTQSLNVITPVLGVAEAFLQWYQAAKLAKIASLQANAAAAGGSVVAGAAAGTGAAVAGSAGVASAGGAGATGLGAAGVGAIAGTTLIGGGAGLLAGYGLYRAGQSVGLIDREQGFGDRMATGWGRFRDFVTRNPGNYDREVQNQWRGENAAAMVAQMNAAKGNKTKQQRMAAMMASGAFSDEMGDEVLTDPAAIIAKVSSRAPVSSGAALVQSSSGDFTPRTRRSNSSTIQRAADMAEGFETSIDIERLQAANEIQKARIEQANKGRLESEERDLKTELQRIEALRDSKAITSKKAEQMTERLRAAYDSRTRLMEAEAEFQIAQLEAQEEIAKAQLDAATQTGAQQKATIERAKLVANRILTIAGMKLNGVRDSINQMAQQAAAQGQGARANPHTLRMQGLMRGMPQADAANWITKMSHGHRTNNGDYGAGMALGNLMQGKDPRTGMVEGFKSLDEERAAMLAFQERFKVPMRGGALQLPQFNYSGVNNALSQGYRGYNGSSMAFAGADVSGLSGAAGGLFGSAQTEVASVREISPGKVEISFKPAVVELKNQGNARRLGMGSVPASNH